MINFTPPPSDLVDLKFREEWFEASLVDKYNAFLGLEFDVHIKDIIGLLNATIKSVNVVGFNVPTVEQNQGNGISFSTAQMLGTKSWQQALNDSTIVITMFHTEGYLTWLFLWETIQRQFTQSHQNGIKDAFVVTILNAKRQPVFDFVFNQFLFSAIDDLELDAETQNNDFGRFTLGITFKTANAQVKPLGVRNPH